MAIDVVVEEVADNLEEIAEATRSINTSAVGYFIGGVCIGAGLGFYFGYRFNRERIKAEAFKQSEEEVEKLRELYQQKTVAAQVKPSVKEIVAERGYSVKVEDEGLVEEDFRSLPAPVPVQNPIGWNPRTDPIMASRSIPDDVSIDVWNYPEELANRSKDHPYVIHQDEFRNSDNTYSQVVYTYYSEDDVIAGDDDRPIPHADLVVGQDNLKWGHGTDDPDVVFVRNDRLELEMEICRIPGSYEREVLGLEDDESS